MIPDLRSRALSRILPMLALTCMLALAWACAKAPGEPDCPGINWDRSPCETDSYYVVYTEVLPYRETIHQLAAGQNPDIGVTLKEFCNQGSGIGVWGEYDGEGKPEPRFYALAVLLADSATAAATRQLLDSADVAKDTEGYYDYGWIVTTTPPLSEEALDSVTAVLDDSGIEIEDNWTEDDSALLFFGTCLSRKAADALRDQLGKRDVSAVVLQLEYLELDI